MRTICAILLVVVLPLTGQSPRSRTRMAPKTQVGQTTPPQGLPAGALLTMNSLGPLKVGMTPRDAERILGVKLGYRGEKEGPEFIGNREKYPGVVLYIEKGVIVFIEAHAAGYKTDKGVSVGQDVAQVIRNYKSLEIHEARYSEECRDIYLEPQYPDHYDKIGAKVRSEFVGMSTRIFLNKDLNVEWIRVGMKSAVNMEEFETSSESEFLKAETSRAPLGQMNPVSEGGFFDARYNHNVRREKWRQHLGTDFRAEGATLVRATRSGTIVENQNPNDPFEARVIVQHPDGSRAVYGHVHSTLAEGATVTQGALVGLVRSSAHQYEFVAHLHYGENRLGKVGTDRNPAGWGWGRAPENATKSEATALGWVDVQAEYGWGR